MLPPACHRSDGEPLTVADAIEEAMREGRVLPGDAMYIATDVVGSGTLLARAEARALADAICSLLAARCSAVASRRAASRAAK